MRPFRTEDEGLLFGVAKLAFGEQDDCRTLAALERDTVFVAAGIGIGLGETAQSAAVAAFSPAELRGSAFGLVAGIQSFANLGASAVAGVLWTALSAEVAFAYLAGWMALALLLFVVTPRMESR